MMFWGSFDFSVLPFGSYMGNSLPKAPRIHSDLILIGLRPMVDGSGWSLGRLVDVDSRTLDSLTHRRAEGATHPGSVTYTAGGIERWFLTDFSELCGIVSSDRRSSYEFWGPFFDFQPSTFNVQLVVMAARMM